MVGLAHVPIVETDGYADSQRAFWNTRVRTPRDAEGLSISKEERQDLRVTGEEPQRQLFDVPHTIISYSVTGAQIPWHAQLAVRTEDIFYNKVLVPVPDNRPRQTAIRELPRLKIVTSFEPHLRQSTVKSLQSLFAQFRQSIGTPMAAVVKAELVASLTYNYKKTVLRAETRNFASAISILQDFLRPHWSEISSDKIQAISDKLSDLVSCRELDPAVLRKFYRELVGITGSGIFIEIPEDQIDKDSDTE